MVNATHSEALDTISHITDELSCIAGLLADSNGSTWSPNGLSLLLQRFVVDLAAAERALNDSALREAINIVTDREAKKR